MTIFNTLLLSLAPIAPDAVTAWDAPGVYISGSPFEVTVSIEAAEGGEVPAWHLSPAAFELGKKPLGDRGKSSVELAKGAKLTLSYDLGPAIEASGGGKGAFKLAFAGGEAREVSVMQAAPAGLDFMSMDAAELSKYRVLMETTSGDMMMEFWPDVALGHVRNFLDLSYTDFYDGLTFHRVIPGFMIQGGCPRGNGSGNGPRTLQAEFNDRKHVPGVLSMARTADPNSASCQFFVMHANATHLDGQYSAFGRVTSDLSVVDRIVKTRGPGDRPTVKQEIKNATVLVAN